MLTVDPQINIARIESRVAAGGHNVDSSKVISKDIIKSINNIKRVYLIYAILCMFMIIPNHQKELFVSINEELSIYPNEYWSEQDILGLME